LNTNFDTAAIRGSARRPPSPPPAELSGLSKLFFPHCGRMNSMTGHGRGECSQNGFKLTVELSSVNRKQSEISVSLPRELEVLEAQMRDEINRRIARGRLTCRVSLHAAG